MNPTIRAHGIVRNSSSSSRSSSSSNKFLPLCHSLFFTSLSLSLSLMYSCLMYIFRSIYVYTRPNRTRTKAKRVYHFSECFFPHVNQSDNMMFQISCVTCRDKTKKKIKRRRTGRERIKPVWNKEKKFPLRLNAYIRIATFAIIYQYGMCIRSYLNS